MNDNKIEKEVEQTMNSLDNLSPAEIDPFLYTRVMNRINASTDQVWFAQRQVKWVLAVLVLLLCINIFSYFQISSQNQVDTREMYLESFAANYGWEYNNMYDLTLPEHE